MEKLKTTGHAPVNGINMYYEIYGEGDLPLVLIHGGGSTIQSSFGVLLPMLCERGKVIGVELQAHGRTTDRDAPETFEQDADDVAALIRFLNVPKANVLGFSNGGSTAMQLAIRHPEIVNKIMVIAGAYQREGFIPALFEGMPHATLSDMPKALQDAFLAVTPDQNRLQTMFEKDVDRMIHFKDWPEQKLRSINAPALFICSDQDVVTPAHTLKMSQLVPAGRLIVLPGVHGAYIGAAEAPRDAMLPSITAGFIENFLAG